MVVHGNHHCPTTVIELFFLKILKETLLKFNGPCVCFKPVILLIPSLVLLNELEWSKKWLFSPLTNSSEISSYALRVLVRSLIVFHVPYVNRIISSPNLR